MRGLSHFNKNSYRKGADSRLPPAPVSAWDYGFIGLKPTASNTALASSPVR